MSNSVNHPDHYNKHPSGVECIDVIQHMNFCLGSAVKYIWRADHKDDDIEDLQKALWLIKQEITRRKAVEDKEKRLRGSLGPEHKPRITITDEGKIEETYIEKGSLLDSKNRL
jgi:hypothetical protein